MTVDQFIDLALMASTAGVALAYLPGAVRDWQGKHSARDTRSMERYAQQRDALR